MQNTVVCLVLSLCSVLGGEIFVFNFFAYFFCLSFFLTKVFMSLGKWTLFYGWLSEIRPFSTGLELLLRYPFRRHTLISLSGHYFKKCFNNLDNCIFQFFYYFCKSSAISNESTFETLRNAGFPL